jgi:hypothetical protein
MRLALGHLWRSSGSVDRGTYALVGVVGFALKHNLDRLVATYGFHRPWGLFNYWIPVRDVARITELRHGEAMFLGTMVALALPFIWVGVVLTIKRLRSAGLPTQLVGLFFVPILNLVFFLMLCLVPREIAQPQRAPSIRRAPPWCEYFRKAFWEAQQSQCSSPYRLDWAQRCSGPKCCRTTAGVCSWPFPSPWDLRPRWFTDSGSRAA